MSFARHQAVGAYQRWEPQDFDAPDADAPATEAEPAPPEESEEQAGPAAESIAEQPPEPPVKLPTAADIEAMFEDARRDGYAAGYQEGADEARRQAAQLASLAEALDANLGRLDAEVGEELITLAIEIARKVVRHTLAEAPVAVGEIVREALQQLPQNHVTIHVHPDDAALLREHLAEPSGQLPHRLIEDTSVTRGGCRLQAAGSEIDATVETRWRRILEGLGRADAKWESDES